MLFSSSTKGKVPFLICTFRYDCDPLYWTHNKGQQSSRLSTTYGTSMRKGTVPFVLELRSMTFYLSTTLQREICDGQGHIYNRTAFLLTFLKFSAVICFFWSDIKVFFWNKKTLDSISAHFGGSERSPPIKYSTPQYLRCWEVYLSISWKGAICRNLNLNAHDPHLHSAYQTDWNIWRQ